MHNRRLTTGISRGFTCVIQTASARSLCKTAMFFKLACELFFLWLTAGGCSFGPHRRPEITCSSVASSTAGHLPVTKKLTSIFPNGPRPSDDQLDIIVADTEGMLYSVLQSYLTDFVSVLELVEGLGDPDDVYKRKVKKGAHCADVS